MTESPVERGKAVHLWVIAVSIGVWVLTSAVMLLALFKLSAQADQNNQDDVWAGDPQPDSHKEVLSSEIPTRPILNESTP